MIVSVSKALVSGLLLAAASTYASPTYQDRNIRRMRKRAPALSTTNITWGDCEQPTDGLPVQCGKLLVPLDWLDTSSNTTMITLELIKYPAATQPAPRGSILLNYGGPGEDGLNNLIAYYPLQAPIIGDEYDLISWDPRGTRNTIPFYCWQPGSDTTGQIAQLGLTWWNTTDMTPTRLWQETETVAELCYGEHKNTGDYLGMASVSRDMIAIVDALGEDGLLRYWGISGGTVLGATVAAMFPDRVDRVIIDGVLNWQDYYNSPVEVEWSAQPDATFEGLLQACLEVGTEACPFAKYGSTVEELEAVWEQTLVDTKYNPIPYYFSTDAADSGGVITYSDYMYQVMNNLYRPYDFPNISRTMDAVVRRDFVTLIDIASGGELLNPPTTNVTEPTDPAPKTIATPGIRCGDKRANNHNFTDFLPYVEHAMEESKWFWGYGLGYNALMCGHWKFEAKYRYDGPWEGLSTKNPILVIGNTKDPVTPVVSAKNVSASFEGSGLLTIDAFGHTSLVRGSESDCAFDAIRAYLNNGTLPDEGTVCQTNKKLSEVWLEVAV